MVSAPVTVGSATVSSGSVAPTSGNGTNTITVNLTGIANAQNVTITLLCASDGMNRGDLSVVMGVLAGDTNGNRSVTASDVGQVKSQSSQPGGASNFRTAASMRRMSAS